MGHRRVRFDGDGVEGDGVGPSVVIDLATVRRVKLRLVMMVVLGFLISSVTERTIVVTIEVVSGLLSHSDD